MSKKKLKMILVSLLIMVSIVGLRAFSAQAAPADPTPRKVEQADGSVIDVKVYGDEFFHWYETLDGDVIAYDEKTKNWHYAYISDDQLLPGIEVVGKLPRISIPGIQTRITVDDMENLFENIDKPEITPSSSVLTKNRLPLLVLLIEFNDRQFSTTYHTSGLPSTTAYWSNEYFGTTGKTVNTYFKEVSHDFDLQFTKPEFNVANGFRITNPTPDVAFVEIRDGVALVRLNRNHPDSAGTAGARAPVNAALAAIRDYIDFSNVPSVDGSILVEDFPITSVLAGYEASSSANRPSIWAHASYSSDFINGMWQDVSIRSNGVLGTYATQGELYSQTGPLPIGVAVHELGHVLGLPDLYDYSSRSVGLGGYSLMANGGWGSEMFEIAGTTPTHLDPWSKVQLGFVTPTTVSATEYEKVNLNSIGGFSTPYNVLKIVSELDPKQYFLVENRQHSGFDRGLWRYTNGSGVLIYHVDEHVIESGGRINSNHLHKAIELETMVQQTNRNPFYELDGIRNEFSADTMPNSNFHIAGHNTVTNPNDPAIDCHPQTVVTDIGIYVKSNSGHVMEVEVGREKESDCKIIAEGKFPDQTGVNGVKGASWTLCEDGMLRVGEGFIHWTATSSPWNAHRTEIKETTFTGPITAGTSLANLFRNLPNVITIEGLEYFDTSNVTNMQNMFSNASSLTSLDVSKWDTGNVTDMSGMFFYATRLTNLDVSNWDTSNVTSMSTMFSRTTNLTNLDVSSWDTSNVTSMGSMFSDASPPVDISKWDTSNVTNMSGMFSSAIALTSLDLSSWDTSNVTNMRAMFHFTNSLTSLDVSSWDTSNVTDMRDMFRDTNSLTSLDLSSWDISNVTDMSNMFNGAISLTSLDLSKWDASRVINMDRMFSRTFALSTLTLGEKFVFRRPLSAQSPDLPAVVQNDEFTGFWQNVGNGTAERPNGGHVLTSAQLMSQFNGSTMADTWVWQPVASDDCKVIAEGRLPDQAGANGLKGATWTLCEDGMLTVGEGFIHWTATSSPWNAHRTEIKEITFTGPITAGTSLSGLFRDLPNVTTIEGLEYFDTSNVTNMSGMFISARALTSLDVSKWDTGKVTDMSSMFSGASALTSLNVSKWDTSSVTDMRSMFNSVESITSLDVSKWDTSSVIHMQNMFINTHVLTSLDVSKWDTSNVTNMSGMFRGMFGTTGITSLDVSKWDTSSVTNMQDMFRNASVLTSLDLSNWDTSNVANMSGMFLGTSALRTLTLGEKFIFAQSSGLPAVVQNDEFTGLWQNIGNGTAQRPNGSYALTSTQLMSQFNGSTMADTWVWQPLR